MALECRVRADRKLDNDGPRLPAPLGLLAFYRTPLGQKMIAKMPALMQDSMTVGVQWGQSKAAEIVERLKAKGFEPATT